MVRLGNYYRYFYTDIRNSLVFFLKPHAIFFSNSGINYQLRNGGSNLLRMGERERKEERKGFCHTLKKNPSTAKRP